jgi:hypothetical protein
MTMDDKTRNRALFSEWLSGAGLILGSGVYLKAHWSAAGTTLIRKISDRFGLVSEATYDNSY